MTPRDRRIRRFRLACRSEEDARRAQCLAEDAFRTASLQDEGRLIVIRSLSLGPMSSEATSTEWSLRLEQRVQALRSMSVHALAPAASTAAAVWFADGSEAWLALALRAADHASCSEWFWQPAAPGWSPSMSPPETLRLAFHRLGDVGGLGATLVLARHLMSAGRLQALADALTPQDVERVMPSFEGTDEPAKDMPSEASPSEDGAGPTTALLPAPWRPVVAGLIRSARPGDARIPWMIAAGLAAAGAAPLSGVAMRGAVRRVLGALRRATQDVSSHGRVERPRVGAADDEPGREAQAVSRQDHEAGRVEPLRLKASDEGPSAWVETAGPGRGAQEPGLPGGIEWPPGCRERDGILTGLGGLFFMIPLFERLGADALPDPAGVAWQVLGLAAARLALSDESDLLASMPPTAAGEPMPFLLSRLMPLEASVLAVARWQQGWRVLMDGAGRLPMAAWKHRAPDAVRRALEGHSLRRRRPFPASFHPAAMALALGAHRCSRRLCGLGLPALVRRPARFSITTTHVDVFFRAAEADARIRKAALDLDPGWVPWLGRVVTFHYSRTD